MVLRNYVQGCCRETAHESFDDPLLAKKLSFAEIPLPSALLFLDLLKELLVLKQDCC